MFTTEVLLRSEETEDALGLVRNTVPAGWDGPPLHHHSFAEAFYVLEGELTFQSGDTVSTAGPGDTVFAPGGSVHTLANHGDAPATYLLTITPGGFERRFDALAAEIAGTEPPETVAKGWPETIVVGPPIPRQ